jgi:hypothetical protein
MSDSEADLPSAYAEWRRLAQAEGNAIRSGNWSFVAECQDALRRLQTTIDRLTVESHPAQLENRSSKQVSRGTILELIELQHRNLISLQQRRERLSAEIENVSRAGKNLRDIQRSYSAPAPPAWSSYS